jgi:prepilin-type N-terminal cleavage/methylation domain-containing protein
MKKGFSLVEMLFYLAILSLLLLVVINCVVIIVSSYRNVRAEQTIENSAVAAMDRITEEIRNAVSVDSLNSTLGSSPGILSLNTATTSPAQIKFDGSTSTLAVYEDGSYSGPLFSGEARVKSLIFRSISTTTSSAIRIELEVESGTSTSYVSKKFYDTAILRGSYQ